MSPRCTRNLKLSWRHKLFTTSKVDVATLIPAVFFQLKKRLFGHKRSRSDPELDDLIAPVTNGVERSSAAGKSSKEVSSAIMPFNIHLLFTNNLLNYSQCVCVCLKLALTVPHHLAESLI